MLKLVIAGLLGYLIGSVTFGVLIPKFMGSDGDIRNEGSGSVGATNVLRTRGKLQGGLVLAGDLAKGLAAVGAGYAIGGVQCAAIAGACAILGHCFPLYFGFKGGKAVATSAGAIFLLFPKAMLILIPVFVIAVAVSRIVSVGSLLAAVTLVLCVFLFYPPAPVTAFCLAAAALVIWKHKDNIRRILSGTENKLDFNSAKKNNHSD